MRKRGRRRDGGGEEACGFLNSMLVKTGMFFICCYILQFVVSPKKKKPEGMKLITKWFGEEKLNKCIFLLEEKWESICQWLSNVIFKGVRSSELLNLTGSITLDQPMSHLLCSPLVKLFSSPLIFAKGSFPSQPVL